MNRRYSLLPLVCSMVACADQPLTTGPTASIPSFEIADAASDYKAGFYWLAPMAKQPNVNGTFDAVLSPRMEICELVDNACGPVIADYTTTTGPGGETVRLSVDDEHYQVNWQTDESGLSTTKLYRVSVRAGIYDVLLGYADVQPVSNGSGLKNVATDDYIGLKDGRTLPIKFRIETELVGQVEVQPVEATAEPGTTQQFTAILRDLHANLMTADVGWASSDESVATVDQSGLATAIGDGTTIITATSERITGSATLHVAGGVVVAVASGFSHSCVINEAGRAYCWGANDRGQLGNGTTTHRTTPTAVSGGVTFAAITVGHLHTCGIAIGGQAFCWGEGFGGRIGNGSFVSQSAPTAVSGSLNFASISAGDSHTCAITTAGQAFCWGSGFSGQLGNGSTGNRPTPTAVSGNRLFASVESGFGHTCGITTVGQAFCWGSGLFGQLGNGLNATRTSPQAVSGGLSFASISAGDSHTCGITAGGQAYCWGLGSFGRLGNGGTANSSVPVAVSGGLAFAAITTGESHTCGITTGGQAYCWGLNSHGQLGVGTPFPSTSTTPIAVTGGLTFASISAGRVTNCAFTTDGQTYCWGIGELGNGLTFDTKAPVAVAPLQ